MRASGTIRAAVYAALPLRAAAVVATVLAVAGAARATPRTCGGGAALNPATALDKHDAFGSPSRNIRCVAHWRPGHGEVTCITLSGSGGYTVSALGPVQRFEPCDPLVDHFRVIPYGSTWRGGTFRCHSGKNGMRCSSMLSHHGFFLSRQHSYRF